MESSGVLCVRLRHALRYDVYGGPENALVDFGHMAFPDIDTLTVSPEPENPVGISTSGVREVRA